MENRQGFIFYYSFYEALSELPDKNQLELYKAISQYSFDGEEPTNLTGVSVPMWKLIRPQLEANNKRYIDGCKGGRPSKKTTGFDEKKTTGYENKKPKEKEKEKEKEKDKEKIKDKEKDNNNHPTDEFDDALFEFKKMRKQIKKPLTEKGEELIIKKLQTRYPNQKDLQIKCLYKSIENGWQGVFELKQEDIRGYSPPGKKKLAIVDENKIFTLDELGGYSKSNN